VNVERLVLEKGLDPDVFGRYYYLKEELVCFCDSEQICSRGHKQELTDRIREYLQTGVVIDNTTHAVVRTRHREIDDSTILGEGFVCTEEARRYFVAYLGTGFRFRVPFVRWIRDNPGKTFADATKQYDSIINDLKSNNTVIGDQFEYNRYIRDYYSDNPDGDLVSAIRCWKYKKSLEGNHRYNHRIYRF